MTMAPTTITTTIMIMIMIMTISTITAIWVRWTFGFARWRVC